MLSPSPVPIPADRRRDRVAAGVALALHVLAAGVLLALPERKPLHEDLDLRVIELLPADFEAPPPPPEEPAEEPPPEEVPPAEAPPEPTPVDVEEPAPPDEPNVPEAPPAPEPAPAQPTPPPTAAPEPPPVPPTLPEDEGDKAPGVALLGLRQPSQPSGSALAPRVRWSPSMAGGPGGGGGGGRGKPSDTTVNQPQPMIEGKPRTLEEAGFVTRRNGQIVYKDPERRFNATLHPDGRLSFRNRIGTPFAAMPGLTEAMRDASDQELYRIEKRRLLEATEELRMAYAARHAEKNVTQELSGLERQLEAIWKRASLTPEQRRALLFERWDECEEAQPRTGEGGSEMDDMRQKAGAVARRKIEAFIRRTLPRGSPDAYSEAELRALNANRHSKQPFSPYRDG